MSCMTIPFYVGGGAYLSLWWMYSFSFSAQDKIVFRNQFSNSVTTGGSEESDSKANPRKARFFQIKRYFETLTSDEKAVTRVNSAFFTYRTTTPSQKLHC